VIAANAAIAAEMRRDKASFRIWKPPSGAPFHTRARLFENATRAGNCKFVQPEGKVPEGLVREVPRPDGVRDRRRQASSGYPLDERQRPDYPEAIDASESGGQAGHLKIRVVIVDDHPIVCETVAAILGKYADIEVVACPGTVAGAVAAVKRESPDVVLMDFRLPDGSGPDATATIRRHRPPPAVVFLTADDSDHALQQAAESGACGYLVKSASAGKIVDAVRRAARGEMSLPIGRLVERLAR
jgi:CheY-like chemotaxis protein